jgi:hypothetical protein
VCVCVCVCVGELAATGTCVYRMRIAADVEPFADFGVRVWNVAHELPV